MEKKSKTKQTIKNNPKAPTTFSPPVFSGPQLVCCLPSSIQSLLYVRFIYNVQGLIVLNRSNREKYIDSIFQEMDFPSFIFKESKELKAHRILLLRKMF